MDNEAHGFIDYEQVRIFVHDPQWDSFGLMARRRRVQYRRSDPVAL